MIYERNIDVSYLDRIKACNNYTLKDFRPFYVGGVRVGHIKDNFAEQLQCWPTIFLVSPTAVHLALDLQSFEERTQKVSAVLKALIDKGVIPRWHGEEYPVTESSREQALFVIDRGAAPYLGVRAFGQHVNGFIKDKGRLKMWIGRRSRNRWSAPGKLDNMIAGGLPHGISLQENLAKECWEEAAIPADLFSQAIPVGYISYRAETLEGFKPDVMYCYDLELPPDFVPQCQDGEVEEFYLWPLEKVAALVRDTDAFKKNCNLVIIDFLIRRGFIAPEHPDYLEIIASLRVPP
jgi:8-oxo-dGTP pyrophosphatase MutT (NUDIX family)